MQLTIEIEVQDCDSSDISVTNQCENLTLEIIDAPFSDSVSIDDSAGIGDTDVTWSADKSARGLADKVDAEAGMGLSELSFTTVDKFSLDRSEQDRHTHNNKTVIDDLSDDAGVLQYKGLPISDQAALDAKVDKAAGYSLVDDAEIAKLATIQENATANRDDALNADKVHAHTTDQVAGLDSALAGKVSNTDPRLTDAREWSADTVPQAEAEEGTASTRRAWTAQRVRQAVVAWWNDITSAFGRGFVASADASAGRTALGLGTAATRADDYFATAEQVGDISAALDAINGEVI